MKKTGKTRDLTLTDRGRALAFKKALLPVHKEMESRIGKDMIKAIYKETGFDPAKL